MDFEYNPPFEPYLDILYHDETILIVDKPAELLSVPGKTENLYDCVESRAQQSFPKARIVHRLDMATSGVMALALTRKAHRQLSAQFAERHTDKSYIAKVSGLITDDEGEINLPLMVDWPNRPLQKVDHKEGKPALTKWRVIKRDADTTLLYLFPETGRTHQLRVHMQAIGHPILGDRFYAPEDIQAMSDRLLLHAETLELTHPKTDERMKFSSVCPFE